MVMREKIAIVTGGSKGIGYAIAKALVDEGMRVAITGRSRESLAAAEQALNGGDRVLTFAGDVGNLADVRRALEGTIERWGGLDVLVNNAGLGRFAAIADTPPEAWHEVIGTNLTGVYYWCHEAIPHLRSRGGGWIVNISSLAGKNAFAGGGAYCASKAALNAFSEVLMQEVRYDGIRVSYIMPGSVDTAFDGPAGRTSGGEAWKIAPSDVADMVVMLLESPARTLSSRIEMRPSQPKKSR